MKENAHFHPEAARRLYCTHKEIMPDHQVDRVEPVQGRRERAPADPEEGKRWW